MSISFNCPHCGVSKTIDDQYAGQTGPCAECGKVITIPGGVSPKVSAKSGGGGLMLVLVICGVCGVGALIVIGILVAMLLPAVSAARGAARRVQCMNNVKQLGLAMHNYHDVYGSFPAPYIADEDGNPMHSWRVAILPFLEQNFLAEQYNYDEPWDSPNNMALANQMPEAFRCPSSTGPPNTSNYMLVVGAGACFEEGKWLKIREFTDGLSNTIMFAETSGSTTNWLEPVDLDIDDVRAAGVNGAADGTTISSEHPGGAIISTADGAVHFIPDTVSAETLDGMLTRDAGEPVMINF